MASLASCSSPLGRGWLVCARPRKSCNKSWKHSSNPRVRTPESTRPWRNFANPRTSSRCNQLSSNEWLEHDREYHEALSKAAGLHEEVRELVLNTGKSRGSGRQSRWWRGGLLLQQLAELGDVVRLREDFGAEFRETQNKLGLAEQTIKQTRLEIADIDARLDQLDLPRLLLDAGPEIEALQERLGAVEKATLDRIRIENFRDDSEHQSSTFSASWAIRRSRCAESLRLRIDEPMVIRQLGQRSAQLRGQAEERGGQSSATKTRSSASTRPQPTWNSRDVEPLRVVVRRVRKAGDLDARLAEARGRLARVEKKASLTLSQLPGWSRSPEDLQRLSVPFGATLDQFEARFQAIAQDAKASTNGWPPKRSRSARSNPCFKPLSCSRTCRLKRCWKPPASAVILAGSS